MPLTLNLSDPEITHVHRLVQTYHGTLRNEMMRALLDLAQLKARITALEAAARPVCECEGKYGDKFVRVPHDIHAALHEVLRA